MGDICKVCGCTDDKPCITEEGPCHWVMRGFCSACCIVLPAGENCFKKEKVDLIIPKKCEACALIAESVIAQKNSYTCSKGKFDGTTIPPGGHQWFAWRGIQRPNKTVARAQRHCPYWEVHPRYKA